MIKEGKSGELFESGNVEDLKEKITRMWETDTLTDYYRKNCKDIDFDTVKNYCGNLIRIYEGGLYEASIFDYCA